MYPFHRFLIAALVFLFLQTIADAQESTFQKSLTQEEIQNFKEEMVFKYRMFFESVLNIIDNDNNIFSRRNAYYLINSLFANEEASISDYLDNKLPETLTLKDYGQRLFMLENVLPLLDKRYKFSDSIYVRPYVKDINPKYVDLSNTDQKKKLFQVYKGEVFFIEEIISVQKVRKDVYDAIDRNVVKKLSFEITHDQDDSYRLFITSISILDPRNRAYDYKKIKHEIRSSAQPWSDKADPDYLKAIEKEALARGITLVGEKKITYDGIDNNKNSWYYESPTFWDYAIPGYGHLRFGADKVRYRDAIIHTGTTLGSAGLAFYFHKKSNNYLNLYNENRSSESASVYRGRSMVFDKRSKVLAVTAIASYVVDMIHLFNKNKNQKNLINKVISSTGVDISIYDGWVQAEYGILVKF